MVSAHFGRGGAHHRALTCRPSIPRATAVGRPVAGIIGGVHVRSLTTPSSQSYAVTVEWLPRWRLLAGRFSGWRGRRGKANKGKTSWLDNLDIPWSFDVDDLLAGIALLVAFVVFALLFWWLLLPALLLVLDGLVVGVLLLVGVTARVVLRRPWTVLVRRTDDSDGEATAIRIQVTGWRRALRTRDVIADALASGTSVAAATSTTPA